MTVKKFTDEEIKKALECCIPQCHATCEECPLFEHKMTATTTGVWCDTIMLRNALDLINRQNAEIESLGNSVRLQAEMLYDAKSHAYKEFAERLTHTLVINNEENTDYFDFAYTLETIDNLVKEMTGETKPEKCDCFCEEQRIKGWLDGNTPITELITVCNGTRERDECTCGGDKSKCDFYAKDYSYGY